MSSYHLDHLQYLETEAIHVLREVAAEFERPAVLFSGGKDSICILRLAEKAFCPSDIPMPFLNVETGHEFPELINFRDQRAEELGAKLIVRTVDEAFEQGLATPMPGQISRNALQIPVLLGAIEEFQFDDLRDFYDTHHAFSEDEKQPTFSSNFFCRSSSSFSILDVRSSKSF